LKFKDEIAYIDIENDGITSQTILILPEYFKLSPEAMNFYKVL